MIRFRHKYKSKFFNNIYVVPYFIMKKYKLSEELKLRNWHFRIGNEIKEIKEDGYEGKNCVH